MSIVDWSKIFHAFCAKKLLLFKTSGLKFKAKSLLNLYLLILLYIIVIIAYNSQFLYIFFKTGLNIGYFMFYYLFKNFLKLLQKKKNQDINLRELILNHFKYWKPKSKDHFNHDFNIFNHLNLNLMIILS